MKKWVILYIIMSMAMVVLGSLYSANERTKTAGYGTLQSGLSNEARFVNTSKGSYLLFRDKQMKRLEVFKTDKGEEKYHILEVRCLKDVYYQYSYQNQMGNTVLGTGICSRSNEEEENKTSVVKEIVTDGGEWLAFDGTGEELFFVQTDKNRTSILEYRLQTEEANWQLKRSIELPEDQKVVAAYLENKLSLYYNDGTAYLYEEETPKEYAGIPAMVSQQEYKDLPEIEIKVLRGLFFKEELQSCLFYGGTVLLLFGLLLLGIFYKGSMIRRLCCFFETVLFLLLMVLGVVLSCKTRMKVTDQASQKAVIYLEQLSKVETAEDVQEKVLELFRDSKGMFLDIIAADTLQMPSKVIGSVFLPRGTRPVIYGKDIQFFIQQAQSEEENRYREVFPMDGKRTLVIACRMTNEDPARKLAIGVISSEWLAKEEQIIYIELHRILMVLFLSGTVLLFVAYRMGKTKWKNFVDALLETAYHKESNYLSEKSLFRRKKTSTDMGSAWSALEEINRSIKEISYEKLKTLNNYHRFAPMSLEQLFHKKSLDEIHTGDAIDVSGCMAQVSYEGKTVSNGEEFIQLATSSYELLSQHIQSYHGVLISNHSDLSELKVLFTEKARSALEFATEAVLGFEQEPRMKDRGILILLHHTSFVYGVSGNAEHAIPLLYSKEDSLLSQYIEPLRRAGMKLVLTENVVRMLQGTDNFRYIGFVSDTEAFRSIKLFESLDVCKESQRKLKLETQQNFDKALELFYSNDFYLARNTFNEVLKVNPADQIARWYLFYCEYHLNSNGEREMSYGLFENKVLEMQYQSK